MFLPCLTCNLKKTAPENPVPAEIKDIPVETAPAPEALPDQNADKQEQPAAQPIANTAEESAKTE